MRSSTLRCNVARLVVHWLALKLSRVLFYSRQVTRWRYILLNRQVMRKTTRPRLLQVNAGMPGTRLVQHRHFYGFSLCQSGIGLPATGSVQFRWSRISPALPSYGSTLPAPLSLGEPAPTLVALAAGPGIFSCFLQVERFQIYRI